MSSVEPDVTMLGSYTETYSITAASGAVSYQLMRAPWPSPVNKKVKVLQLVATAQNLGISSANCSLVFWDQDLSNSTPPSRGSAGGALLTLGIGSGPVSGSYGQTACFSDSQIPELTFRAGIAFQASTANVNIAATVLMI